MADEPKNEWQYGRSWSKGPTYLVLERATNADRQFYRAAPGLENLAFHARPREQVDNLTPGVREQDDATVLYGEQHPYAGSYYALYCEQPDALTVEIFGPEWIAVASASFTCIERPEQSVLPGEPLRHAPWTVRNRFESPAVSRNSGASDSGRVRHHGLGRRGIGPT